MRSSAARRRRIVNDLPMRFVRESRKARLLAVNLGPRKLAHEQDFFVDVVLRRLVAEDAAQVLDFRRDELVVLRKETLRGALEVAFRHGDLFRGAHHQMFVHGDRNPTMEGWTDEGPRSRVRVTDALHVQGVVHSLRPQPALGSWLLALSAHGRPAPPRAKSQHPRATSLEPRRITLRHGPRS